MVIRECKPASLARVDVLLCHAQPASHPACLPACLLSTGGRLLPFSSFGVCRARQGKTAQGFGSNGAHHWPKTTGCRISRGWLPAHRGLWIGEAPGGVGSCRDDWKSLNELGARHYYRLAQGRSARGAVFSLFYLPACAATAASDTGAASWVSGQATKEGCAMACVKRRVVAHQQACDGRYGQPWPIHGTWPCLHVRQGCRGHQACVNGRVALSEAYSHTQPRRP